MISSAQSLVGGAIIAYLLLIPILGSVVGLGTYIIIVVANRADPDPSGKRPISVYLFATAFLTLWIAYIGAVVIVSSLVNLIGTTVVYSASVHPVGDSAARGVSVGLLLLIVAGVIYGFHLRRGLALADSESDPASPTKRVARSYVSSVSFISIILFVVMVIASAYTVLGLIAPGVYLASSRTTSTKGLLVELFVVLISLAIFSYHQSLAPRALRLWGGRERPMPIMETSDVMAPPAGDTES